jgi:hypothetical protein
MCGAIHLLEEGCTNNSIFLKNPKISAFNALLWGGVSGSQQMQEKRVTFNAMSDAMYDGDAHTNMERTIHVTKERSNRASQRERTEGVSGQELALNRKGSKVAVTAVRRTELQIPLSTTGLANINFPGNAC